MLNEKQIKEYAKKLTDVVFESRVQIHALNRADWDALKSEDEEHERHGEPTTLFPRARFKQNSFTSCTPRARKVIVETSAEAEKGLGQIRDEFTKLSRKGLIEAIPPEASSVLDSWAGRKTVSDDELDAMNAEYGHIYSVSAVINETAERMHSDYRANHAASGELSRIDAAWEYATLNGIISKMGGKYLYECILDDDELPVAGKTAASHRAREAFAKALAGIVDGTDEAASCVVNQEHGFGTRLTRAEAEYLSHCNAANRALGINPYIPNKTFDDEFTNRINQLPDSLKRNYVDQGESVNIGTANCNETTGFYYGNF